MSCESVGEMKRQIRDCDSVKTGGNFECLHVSQRDAKVHFRFFEPARSPSLSLSK